MQAQKFINAYSAFLKRQGKLPIPGMNIAHLLTLSHLFKLPSCNPADSANVVMLTYFKVGLIPSRPVQPRSSHLNPSTGFTFVPPPSLVTSTSAKPSVSVVYERFTDLPATVDPAHRITLMLPEALIVRLCKLLRRLVSWSRMRTREVAVSHNPDSVIWIVSSSTRNLVELLLTFTFTGIAQTTIEADEEDDDDE